MKKKSFNQRVYNKVRKIPYGKVSTYGAIAHALSSRAYRAVGNAMNKNPNAPEVPCHRVIKSTGEIGGFASGIKNKIILLKKEGVIIQDKKIDLKKYRYNFY